MIRKGRYFVPSMNNYESKDDVLILVTDFGMGRLFGYNIKNQENFEWDELSSGDFEYYYEPATNGDVIKAIFPNIQISDGEVMKNVYTGIPYGELIGANIDCMREWWNAPYQKGGK